MPAHVHPFPDKQDPLLFQELTLLQGAPRRVGRTGEDASSRAYHPVPGQPQGTAVHGPAHLTGEVGSAHKGGDLPVGQHLPRRDGAYHAVHPLEEGSFFRMLQWRSPVA